MRGMVAKASVLILLCGVIFGTAGYFSYNLFVAPARLIKKEKAGPPPTQPPDPSLGEFERCMKLKAAGNTAEARAALQDFVEHNPDSTKIDDAKDALGDLNMALMFSTEPSPDKQQYVIQKGDTINSIEHKTKIPGELIMRLNKLDDPTKLRIGEVLNVWRPEFSLRINRKTQVVTLMNKGRFLKRYKVQSWNAPSAKSTAPINAKVGDKVAWKNGQRVSFGSKDYADSGHWIGISASGYTLYTEDPAQGTPKPPGGLGLAPNEMNELSALLNRSTPVTIE